MRERSGGSLRDRGPTCKSYVRNPANEFGRASLRDGRYVGERSARLRDKRDVGDPLGHVGVVGDARKCLTLRIERILCLLTVLLVVFFFMWCIVRSCVWLILTLTDWPAPHHTQYTTHPFSGCETDDRKTVKIPQHHHTISQYISQRSRL